MHRDVKSRLAGMFQIRSGASTRKYMLYDVTRNVSTPKNNNYDNVITAIQTHALEQKKNQRRTRVFDGYYYQREGRRYIAPPTRDCRVFRTRVKENNIFPEMFYIISIHPRAALLYRLLQQ